MKTPKLLFFDVGLVSYPLGIQTPNQMDRDPLWGKMFENLVVLEALKARYNTNRPENLYFFRNSKGLEVDLLLQRNGKLVPFEIKSGQSLNGLYTDSLIRFARKNPDMVENKGTGIYARETYPQFKGFPYCNYSMCGKLFEETTKPFLFSAMHEDVGET